MTEMDSSIRLFNTAVIATKIPRNVPNGTAPSNLGSCSSRLSALVNSPQFQVILRCIHEHAKVSGIPQDIAAEEIIQTFRDIDKVWDEYIFQEGLNKLKQQLSS